MTIVKHNEAPFDVPPAMYEAINKLADDAAKAGCVMVGKGVLLPTAQGTRINVLLAGLDLHPQPLSPSRTLAQPVVGLHRASCAGRTKKGFHLDRH